MLFQLSIENIGFLLVFMGVIGLLVGSFLNVVIIRLPKMLQKNWHENCVELLNTPPSTTAIHSIPPQQSTSFNLCFPGSHCTNCEQPIAWFDNIPLFSFLWLRGHCRRCHYKISLRYPLIELLTCFLSLLIFLQFGLNLQTIAGLIFTWMLLAITFIDIDHQLIPDNLTLPGVWLGLLFNVFGVFQNASDAILGAAAGYLVLWIVYWVFKWITGKEGMGYGDFKLLAMLGAWQGWQSLPYIILISSFLGSCIGISLIVFHKKNKHYPIPFGPFLAFAGWITLLWGSYFNQIYLRFFI